MSWQTRPKDYAELAIKVVRDLVAAHRASGAKTVAAIDMIAPELDIQPRRVRRLFERDRNPFVGLDEYRRILLRGARVLRRKAEWHLEQAERLDAEADLMELNHRQLSLWSGDGAWGFSGNVGKQGHAA